MCARIGTYGKARMSWMVQYHGFVLGLMWRTLHLHVLQGLNALRYTVVSWIMDFEQAVGNRSVLYFQACYIVHVKR